MTKTKKLKLTQRLTKLNKKHSLTKPKNQPINQVKKQPTLTKEEKHNERLKHAKDPYSDNETILLLGEGNFSFALALANKFSEATNLYATSFDSEKELEDKYGEEVVSILTQLKEMDANLLYSIDATNLQRSRKQLLKSINERKGSEYQQSSNDGRRNTSTIEFDKIIFNFPHAGKGIKSQVHNIKTNQKLLLGFFKSVPQYLSKSGQVHITLKSGEPYDSWKVCGLAKQCGFQLKECFPFNCSLYPGYEHRRTLGRLENVVKGENDEIISKKPKTYVFILEGSEDKANQLKQNANKKRKQPASAQKDNSDDDDDDVDKYNDE